MEDRQGGGRKLEATSSIITCLHMKYPHLLTFSPALHGSASSAAFSCTGCLLTFSPPPPPPCHNTSLKHSCCTSLGGWREGGCVPACWHWEWGWILHAAPPLLSHALALLFVLSPQGGDRTACSSSSYMEAHSMPAGTPRQWRRNKTDKIYSVPASSSMAPRLSWRGCTWLLHASPAP